MKKWIIGLAAIGMAFAGYSQGIDWPTHRGVAPRTGVNANPTGPNAGFGSLRWYFPLQSQLSNGANFGTATVVDNAMAGFVTTGTWTAPQPLDESGDFFAMVGSTNPPYVYSRVVAARNNNDPTIGSTATATWSITGLTPGKAYQVDAWFPSSGTTLGGNLLPNSDFAVYRITYGNGSGGTLTYTDIVPHLGGGNWVRLGDNLTTLHRLFRADSAGNITVTLFNTVPLNQQGQPMGPVTNRIVCADAVKASPTPGQIFGSPVVKSVGPGASDVLAYITRVEGVIDPSDPARSLEIPSGNVYALNAVGPTGTIGTVRWSWSPNLLTTAGIAIDNDTPQFTSDAGWTISTVAEGFFGTNYRISPVALVSPGTARAAWTPELADVGNYDVYAWFPASGNGETHARGARYVVMENGVPTEVFVNQDTAGGNWVRIGNRSFSHNPLAGGLSVEVWNHSNNPGDAGRVVCADAVLFVRSYAASIFSTPTIHTVNLRLSDGTIAPTQVMIVAAEDGRIYCLDARGNGTGSTTVYWAYPSIPDRNDPSWVDPNDPIDGPLGNRIPWPSSFGTSSPIIANVGGRDLVYIAAANGRVYAIDAMGRGDYDAPTATPGTARREWTWPRASYDQGTNIVTLEPARLPFAGSVAYDAANSTIFAAGTEGRLFALDAGGNGDQTTDNDWAFPELTTSPVGALSSTPAVGGGKVVVTSFDGHVYARSADGAGGGGWQFPAVGQPTLQPFEFTSVAYVNAALVGSATDLVYFVNENGFLYAVRGTDGVQVFAVDEVPSGAQSSVALAHLTPPGTVRFNTPVITVGTRDGVFLGFYARPAQFNGAGGRLAWGYASSGNSSFASPAMSYGTDGARGYLYQAGIDGYLYAFSQGGGTVIDPGFTLPPGGQWSTPDDPGGNGRYDDMKLKLISRSDYQLLRQNPPTGSPAAMAEIYAGAPVLEFGERMYVLAWDFDLPPAGQIPTIRFQLTGPGGMNLQYDRIAQPDPDDDTKGFAVMSIPVNFSGPNFISPGDLLELRAIAIENGRFITPLAAKRDLTVANPLAVTSVSQFAGNTPPPGRSIGWSSDPSYQFLATFENRINGSNDKRLMTSAGEVNHGSARTTNFFVADRSRVMDIVGGGISGVRIARTDAWWQGGVGAVVKPLPYTPAWEQLPFHVPNFSLDYPDVDRSNMNFLSEANGDPGSPLLEGVRLEPPLNYNPSTPLTRLLSPTQVNFEFTVPRFQPANLTPFLDAGGVSLAGGYVGRSIVYVDSNNNGRPDGQAETLVDLPPGGRREPYRSLAAGGAVPVDEKMHIVENVVDLGSIPHSVGYTPGPPWTMNGFIPSIITGAPFEDFFKPFTLVNEGNVNMLDLRIAKRIGNYSVAFSSDANDPLAWLDGFPNIISNINPPYALNNGALDPAGNPRATLHKARAGDRAGTQLTMPDVPYGVTPPPNSQPLVGVAVPLGFPVGDYSQLVNVIEDNRNFDMTLQLDGNGNPLEAYSDPTMRVKLLNRETRLTGGQSGGSVIHIDPSLAPSGFTYTNTQPSAFRDSAGGLHVVWSGNRPTANNQAATPQARDVWSLFFSRVGGVTPGGAPGPAGNSPLRDLMGWIGAANSRFYNQPSGPLPADPPGTLFGGTPGTIIGSPQFTWPSFPVNARPGASFERIFWNGKVQKDDSGDTRPDFEDNRVFYADYATNGALTNTSWIVRDPRMEKKRIRPINFGDLNTGAIFWYGEANGVTRMFQNAKIGTGNGGDQTANWTDNTLVDPGQGFASARDPQPILRANGIDIVFTGQLKDRPQPEIFYAKFDTDRFGRIDDLDDQPERLFETLVREGNSGTYRARGVTWEEDETMQVFSYRTGVAPTRIDVGRPETDPNTGIISKDSAIGGKVYLDPHVGTVRFSNPPSGDLTIALRYTPKVMRVSELGTAGGHSNPSSFLDLRPQWDREFYFRLGGQPIQAGDIPLATRIWHFYERGATGAGQTRRPYMKSQRLRIQLPTPVALQNGAIVNLQVVGMTGAFYQVDPGNGRVYFELPDEGLERTINYSYRDTAGNIQQTSVTERVDWGTEMAEKPVPIEQAIDEGTIFAFPDPFVWSQNDPRPGVVWLMYTSTRNGTRDVFYQSLAPKFSPIRQ
ncbi:MAG: hypothetical protein M3R13_08100 [Armatimonadota bacterium]|nr:hypothetical protein [Armatimonadota bacterium]